MKNDNNNNKNKNNASALDALASLASSALNLPNHHSMGQAHHHHTVTPSSSSSSSLSSDEEASSCMPPPPPRHRKARLRSVSNPEGMEKWDPTNHHHSSRLHFVLPSSILEEELSSAREACQELEESKAADFALGTSPTTVVLSSLPGVCNNHKSAAGIPLVPKTPEDDSDLEPEELLRRARSRLLEDLSTEAGLQKGALPLPHSLEKYADIYNKNGRIGIYTPAERGAIIARFNEKRARRVWNKKIRYNCRKSLADRRMRVKGRFVKRSVEQEATQRTSTPLTTVKEEEIVTNVDMPDVNDPEANFQPTEDQPFRRPRRHTIT